MKKMRIGDWQLAIFLMVALAAGMARAYPPAPASQAAVNAGTEPYLYVTPKTLAGAGMVTNGAAGGILPLKTKLGFVATRCRYNETFTGANTWFSCRTMHVAKDDITSLEAFWQNFGGSDSTNGTAILSASIEFPSNNFTQLTFSNYVYGTSAPGTIIKSDLVVLNTKIPKGSIFWSRYYYTNSTGIWYSQYADGSVDQAQFNSTGGTDKTMTAGPMGSYSTISYYPLAIVGYTAKPSVLVIGDSRAFGLGEIPECYTALHGLRGAERYFETKYAGSLLSEPGETLAGFVAYPTNRMYFTNFASVVIFDLGINSIGAALVASYSNAVAMFTTCPVIGCTLEPYTTSSDNWATLSGQTVTGSEAYRVSFNNMLRWGQIQGVYSCLDLAAPVESAQNSGLWAITGLTGTNTFTSDGLHPSTIALKAEAASIADIFASVPMLGANGGTVNGSLTVASNLNVQGICYLPTNSSTQLLPPGLCGFWPSNNDLYWKTPLKTNLIILGH